MPQHHPPLLPHQTLLRPLQWHLGIVGIQTQDHSCWIQPAKIRENLWILVRKQGFNCGNRCFNPINHTIQPHNAH